MSIELGDYVKDKITGFEGVVTMVCQWQYNSNRIRIQPTSLSNEGHIKMTETVDEPQLDIVAKQYIVLDIPTQKPRFKFGDEVKDIYTPLKGKVYGIAYHINGCLRIVVQPYELKDGKPVDESWYPQDQLELVTESKEVKRTKTGGPMPEFKERKIPN